MGAFACFIIDYFLSLCVLNLWEAITGTGGEQAILNIVEQLLTGIGDVRVTHGQLANTIVRENTDSPFSMVRRSAL